MPAEFEIVIRDGGGYASQQRTQNPISSGQYNPAPITTSYRQSPQYGQSGSPIYRDYISSQNTSQQFSSSIEVKKEIARQETYLEKQEIDRLRELHANKIIEESDFHRKMSEVRGRYQEHWEASQEMQAHIKKKDNLYTGVYGGGSSLYRDYAKNQQGEVAEQRNRLDNMLIDREQYEKEVAQIRMKYAKIIADEGAAQAQKELERHAYYLKQVHKGNQERYREEHERISQEFAGGLIDRNVFDAEEKVIANKYDEKTIKERTEKEERERYQSQVKSEIDAIRDKIKTPEQRHQEELRKLDNTFDESFHSGEGLTQEEYFARKQQINDKYAVPAEEEEDEEHPFHRHAAAASSVAHATGFHSVASGVHAARGIVGAAESFGMATGGAESAVALAMNPITIGFAVVAGSAVAAGLAVKKFGDHVKATNEVNAQYSIDAANAQAISQIREMQADIYRADRIGPQNAEFENARSSAELALSKLSTEIQSEILETLRKELFILNALSSAISLTADGMKALNSLGINFADFGIGGFNTVNSLLEKIAKYTGILSSKSKEESEAANDVFLNSLLNRFNSINPDMPGRKGK